MGASSSHDDNDSSVVDPAEHIAGTSENKMPQPDKPEDWIFDFANNESLTFRIKEVIGQGTFGTVYRAINVDTQEIVAIKRTKVAKEHQAIETSMLHTLRHRNVVELKYSFSTSLPDGEKEVYIVTEYLSSDLNKVLDYFYANKRRLKEDSIRVFMYQILKGLEFIHRRNVAHRDLKPSNILVNLPNNTLKICDFGSAKKLKGDMENATYICSRYYRAPELLMGYRYYTTAVDMWSCGCIMAELYLGTAIFGGSENADQLKRIEAVLGTPTDREYRDLGQYNLPTVFTTSYPKPWRMVFSEYISDQAIDLISQMIKYSPKKRIDALTALRHPYFDPIRKAMTPLSNRMAPLFDSEVKP